MVMAIDHAILPATLHAATPTPHIDWDTTPLRLLTEAIPWPAADRPRRAAISSFGVSGTNAHLILEQPPDQPGERAGDDQAQDHTALPWLLSAATPQALADQAARLHHHLTVHPAADLAAIAWTLATGRAHHSHRAVIRAAGHVDYRRGLAALADGSPAPEVRTGMAASRGRTVFVFPGQGGQWPGMAVGLLESEPVFREQLLACQTALAPHVDWSLTDVLRGAPGAPPLDRVDIVQPALFAIMVSLAALWRAAGIEPDAVIGHSQGEIAAACIAGALTLPDAARIIALRSQAITALGPVP
jgi:acyl transferase domain-containing protein